MKINEKHLPVLDKPLLGEIFAHVFSSDTTNINGEQKRDFVQMLLSVQHYNYSYRQGNFHEVVKTMEETISPFIVNSDGPLSYFA